ncbi:hypothetical protein EYS14_13705 [Alteromonadaceae bacterium M269]|nr:hypothetical protein EYS14_13705 [Alteromonadaceae bacterium M269]
MNSSKNLLSCCASICEGDGISPRHEKERGNKGKTDNKRLCRQVHKIVRMAIVELGLEGWDIAHVTSHQNGTSMLLCMEPIGSTQSDKIDNLLAWFKQHQGALRAIIAHGIHRKHVPTLQITFN